MKRLVWLAIVLLLALLIPLFMGGMDMLHRLRNFPLPLFLAMFGMVLVGWCANTMRLRLLLGESASGLGMCKSLGVVMATEFAYSATPGGGGAPLTLVALLSRCGIGPAKSTAAFATDQLNDLMFFLLALIGILIYAVFHKLSENLEWMLIASALLIGAGLCSCAGFARYHRRIILFNGRLLKRLNRKHSTQIRWARKLLHFRDALAETWKMPHRTLLKVFALTCVHWSLRYSVLYLALLGLGVDIDWAWTFLVQMLSLSAGQFSLSPGGAGAAELTSAALLAPMVGKSTAAAAILIWRIVTYYFYLVAGGPVFLLMVGKPLLIKLLRIKTA
ncbi:MULTISPECIES: lysylphosphatidylglycerol synthase transmembrane domain-containing protein [unclassified Pseudomonas]|uniref:lysylphosphatidylglycerol synthase transmembrane domain-containing protein n=1 Tax=unclassified Pseudomonas TaxID=196821 RepID=UPI0025E6B0A8|nr:MULTISPECIES: lysylphosphatidylglycerol synthase transmembrane domain-containing protein [unclassified Pseudomonas]